MVTSHAENVYLELVTRGLGLPSVPYGGTPPQSVFARVEWT